MAGKSLAEAYPEERARCRELLTQYRSLPNNCGEFGALVIESALRRADDASAQGDVVAMVRAFAELQSLE